jgi:hypothetical protein
MGGIVSVDLLFERANISNRPPEHKEHKDSALMIALSKEETEQNDDEKEESE